MLEVRLVAGEATVLVDADHDRHRFAVAGHDLWALAARTPDQRAEALLGILQLPAHLPPPNSV